MNRRRKLAAWVLAPIGIVGAAGYAAGDYARGASFVIQAANMQGVARRIAEIDTEAVTESSATVPWRGGELPARWYRPADVSGRPILLVPGVHAGGIEEPRLVLFARDTASMGHPVLTVALPDLARYSITTRTTDMIEDTALWLSRQPGGAGDSRVGMMGISFAGGLSVVAAGRPALRDRVAFVMSFGGHSDLPRTLQYLCTGLQPDGRTRPPHDYGVAIILLGVADHVVPAAQVEPLRHTIQAFLEASHIDVIDKTKGREAFERTRRLTESLAEPARTYMTYVNDRNVAKLGPVLLPYVSALGGDAALSPARSTPPAAAVFLLHGTDDNVIPAIESVLLAEYLRARGAEVHQLATPLITHAEVDKSAALRAFWDLSKFWGDLLSQ
jgi:hypothetical protein